MRTTDTDDDCRRGSRTRNARSYPTYGGERRESESEFERALEMGVFVVIHGLLDGFVDGSML